MAWNRLNANSMISRDRYGGFNTSLNLATGWTGTSIWIDPFSQTFVIFLSNRNHPSESGNVGALRRKLGTLAAEAVSDFNFAYVPGALARTIQEEVAAAPPRGREGMATMSTLEGIDVLARQHFAPLKGMRIGLVTYEYPPQQGLGGVGTYMFRLAGALGRAADELDAPPAESRAGIAGATF